MQLAVQYRKESSLINLLRNYSTITELFAHGKNVAMPALRHYFLELKVIDP